MRPSAEAESTTECIREASCQSKKKSKKSKAKHAGTRNPFDGLHIQEPSLHPLLQDLHHPIRETAADLVDVEFKLKEEDSAFETWCFLQDLNDVRMYVKRSWEDYTKGEISYLAVSSITDAAINLLRRGSDDFDSPFGSKDWLELLDYLGIQYFERGSAIWLHPHSDRKAPVCQTLVSTSWTCFVR